MYVKIILAIIFIGLALWLIPLFAIWGLNVIFEPHIAIPYTLKTWAGIIGVKAIFYGSYR